MKIAYIAHPVSGDVQGNLEKIRQIVRRINLEEPRVLPFAPYWVDCHALDDTVPAERARGIKNDHEFFRRGMIDELRVYGDRISPGMQAEIDLAHKCNIPVVNYIVIQKPEAPPVENDLVIPPCILPGLPEPKTHFLDFANIG